MKKLNTFTENLDKLEFGSYILFQEYVQKEYNGTCYDYKINKPTLGIYLGCFVADMALGFNYVKWNNDKKFIKITNEYVTNCSVISEVEQIDNHIEWNNYIDILGIWKNKPDWKQILSEYRKQNEKIDISEDEFEV